MGESLHLYSYNYPVDTVKAIILGAGSGSRMGDHTADLPKLFLDVAGKTILEWQLEGLAATCDDVLLVLGYGFETDDDPRDSVEELITVPESIDLEVLVCRDWESFENGGTCYRALRSEFVAGEEDLLLVCGDVVFAGDVVARFASDIESDLDRSVSHVFTIEGWQDQRTAVRWDDSGRITEYGAIDGHQEAGVFHLNADHIEEAVRILEANQSEWFPVVFPSVESEPYFVDADEHVEINTPEHLAAAREKVPLESAGRSPADSDERSP